MSFSERRRQEFLSEQHWLQEVVDIPEVISMHASGPSGAADSEAEGWTLSLQSIARIRYEYLSLKYTAGEPIDSLRADLEAVVTARETATEQLRQYERNPNAIGLDRIVRRLLCMPWADRSVLSAPPARPPSTNRSVA